MFIIRKYIKMICFFTHDTSVSRYILLHHDRQKACTLGTETIKQRTPTHPKLSVGSFNPDSHKKLVGGKMQLSIRQIKIMISMGTHGPASCKNSRAMISY